MPSQFYTDQIDPHTPKTPPPKLPRYGPITPIKMECPHTPNQTSQGPLSKDNNKPEEHSQIQCSGPIKEALLLRNPSANEINTAINFFNDHHPNSQAIRPFQDAPFNLFEDAFQAGFNVGRKTS